MSRRWPGWHTLPGIEIAPLAEKARTGGEPVKQYSYVWDVPAQNYVSTCGWQVDPDGTVSVLGDGWEPIVEDGTLKGFRGLKGGRVEELVQISALVVPGGEIQRTPSLTIGLPPEQIGMFRRGDSMADGINIETDHTDASISIGFVNEDGSWTSIAWGVTRESAASTITLIRERHGEPMAEWTADPGNAEALQAKTTEVLGAHTVFNCAHEENEEQ